MGNESGPSAAPRWRRFVVVAVPVALFAAATPFVVNGLASAVRGSSDPTSVTVAATTLPAASDASTAAADVPATTTTFEVTGTTITLPGVAADADQKTVELAAEIISEAPPTSAATTVPVTDPAAADQGTADPTTTQAAGGQTHSHGSVIPEVALTRAERKDLAAQLSEARTTAMKYPTVADALAAGYVKITDYVPLIGAHYVNWKLMDGTFDVTQPEMLLYDGTDPKSSVVGLSYYMFSDTQPSPFAGPNDHWHQHIGLCLKDGVVIGGESMPAAQCTALGGAKAGAGNGWMVHAWVVPGWESPQGVFSPEHSGLTADLPTS